MIHPDTELKFINDDIGYGVFATRFIPRGTITWVLDELDFILPPELVATLSEFHLEAIERFSYIDQHGRHILCWDFGRNVNHACDFSTICLGSICDVAVRDIQPGEQLTCDYATLNIRETLECCCGAPNCRGQIRSEQLPARAATLDRLAAELLPIIAAAAQPLLPFMLADDRARLQAILQGEEPLPSCCENMFPDNFAAPIDSPINASPIASDAHSNGNGNGNGHGHDHGNGHGNGNGNGHGLENGHANGNGHRNENGLWKVTRTRDVS